MSPSPSTSRVLEDQPRDWNTANTLGDLYVRAGQPDKAIAQYTRIADHLVHEGFFSRAAAIYKKILKIKPDDEAAQLQLGELSAKQGLLADAKSYFSVVGDRRRARGDQAGADEMVVRLGSVDPSDFEARLAAARILEESGETIGAAIRFRELHADLLEKDRPAEALAALREAVRLNPDDVRDARSSRARRSRGRSRHRASVPRRRDGRRRPSAAARAADDRSAIRCARSSARWIRQLLAADDTYQGRVVDMAYSLLEELPAAAFVCIDTTVDTLTAASKYTHGADLLQEFVTRVPGQIPALLKLVEICVDGGLESDMYQTQAQLTDAYLATGQGAEARVIAEDLVAREPWEPAHIERFRRALVMLRVPDPDTLIAERLSGQVPFTATDHFVHLGTIAASTPAVVRAAHRWSRQPKRPHPSRHVRRGRENLPTRSKSISRPCSAISKEGRR